MSAHSDVECICATLCSATEGNTFALSEAAASAVCRASAHRT